MSTPHSEAPMSKTSNTCHTRTSMFGLSALGCLVLLGSAGAASPVSLCRTPDSPAFLTRAMSIDSKWTRSLQYVDKGRRVIASSTVVNTPSALAANIRVQPDGGPATMLLRVSDADEPRFGIVGSLGIARTDSGQDVLLGVVTAAGMRFTSVALFVLESGSRLPARVGLANDAYWKVLVRAGMGAGAGDPYRRSKARGLEFINPSVDCEDDSALLVEAWSMAGDQGVACWRLDEKGQVTPLAIYRNVDDASTNVAGDRKGMITRVVKAAGVPTVRTSRWAQAPSPYDGMPSCSDILAASGMETRTPPKRKKPLR